MRPLYVRKLTTEELKTLKEGLRSPSAFTLRRSQILLKSHEGQKAQVIGRTLHCSDQAVRVAIHAFNHEGVACLTEKSHARHDQAPLIDEIGCKRLKELVRLSPRAFGYETSVWIRPLLAQQLQKEGHLERMVSGNSISNALARVGISWRRAKKWIRSPDSQYERRKKKRDWLKEMAREQDDWLLVDQDECWFSRFAQPNMHAFAEAETNVRLVERQPEKKEADKAIACYGAVCQETKERFFSFAEGQPNSEKSIAFLSTLVAAAKARAKRVLVVIWDRATWHKSKQVKEWIRGLNRQAKETEQGVRLIAYLLPSKSPWLNPMEPIWLHTKRKVVEADGDLSVKVLKERLCAQFGTTLEQATLKLSD